LLIPTESKSDNTTYVEGYLLPKQAWAPLDLCYI